jgi:hypothetical protein
MVVTAVMNPFLKNYGAVRLEGEWNAMADPIERALTLSMPGKPIEWQMSRRYGHRFKQRIRSSEYPKLL